MVPVSHHMFCNGSGEAYLKAHIFSSCLALPVTPKAPPVLSFNFFHFDVFQNEMPRASTQGRASVSAEDLWHSQQPRATPAADDEEAGSSLHGTPFLGLPLTANGLTLALVVSLAIA